MSYETMEVRKVTPNIGAEIRGVDLAKGLSNQQFDAIHRALLENLVIFFREQTIDVHLLLRLLPGSRGPGPQPGHPLAGRA